VAVNNQVLAAKEALGASSSSAMLKMLWYRRSRLYQVLAIDKAGKLLWVQ
jgi:hypothetical protein